MMDGYRVGDRVTRPVDVYAGQSPLRHGCVTRRYGKRGGLGSNHWFDPEIYDVLWDDGVEERGFFRHGLDPEPPGHAAYSRDDVGKEPRR